MPGRVGYERVNLAEIETSSDDDDYGNLFRGQNDRKPLTRPASSKRSRCKSASCIRGTCVLTFVVLIFAVLGTVAYFVDTGVAPNIKEPVPNKTSDATTELLSLKNNTTVSPSDVHNATHLNATDTVKANSTSTLASSVATTTATNTTNTNGTNQANSALTGTTGTLNPVSNVSDITASIAASTRNRASSSLAASSAGSLAAGTSAAASSSYFDDGSSDPYSRTSGGMTGGGASASSSASSAGTVRRSPVSKAGYKGPRRRHILA